MASTAVLQQLSMRGSLYSHVGLSGAQFYLTSDLAARCCNYCQRRSVVVVSIEVLGQVSGGIGRGMKDVKDACMTRIMDRIIRIIIQMTGLRLDMTSDLSITIRTVMNREMIIVIPQASAMTIIKSIIVIIFSPVMVIHSLHTLLTHPLQLLHNTHISMPLAINNTHERLPITGMLQKFPKSPQYLTGARLFNVSCRRIK